MKRALSDSEGSLHSDEGAHGDIFEDDDIDDLQRQLAPSIPRDKALDFLHSLAASKHILYWNRHGEMLYQRRRIPVTSITELIDYAMLPYSIDIKSPRGLMLFTKGLAEIGIDKKLIQNKRLLADLVARQPEEDEDSDSSYESGSESSEENDHSEDDDSESVVSDHEPQECYVCEDFKPFYSIAVLQCPMCKWREGYYCRDNQVIECDVCLHPFPVDTNTRKDKFFRCKECYAVHQEKNNELELMDEEHSTEEEN